MKIDERKYLLSLTNDMLDFADVVDKGVIDGEIIGNIHENRDLLK